jgi:hypothetical protein
LAILAWLLVSRSHSTSSLTTDQLPTNRLCSARVFWRPFVAGPERPWVIFSNRAFVGVRDWAALLSGDGSQAIDDHYTGVGEVPAIYDLDHVFVNLHREIRVKRGSLFTLDDAQNNAVDLCGLPRACLISPAPTSPFSSALQLDHAKAIWQCWNLHPVRRGKDISRPSGQPSTEDYAIIGLVPDESRPIALILAGCQYDRNASRSRVRLPSGIHERLLLRLSVSEMGDERLKRCFTLR